MNINPNISNIPMCCTIIQCGRRAWSAADTDTKMFALPQKQSDELSPRRWRFWRGMGLRSGYQRTNEWASVLGIVTGLRIINSHELMCTAAAATAAATTFARARCCWVGWGLKEAEESGSGWVPLYLNLLSASWSLSYFALPRLASTKLISVGDATAASLPFWHRFTCRLPPLATNYTQLEKLPSPHHPS